LRLRLDSGRRRGASACASAAATAVVVGSRTVISGSGLDPGVQARADELALVARGARGVEGRGEDERGGAERPLRLVPGLDHEGQAAARGLQVAAEGRLEASLPVLPGVDALTEDDQHLRVDRVDHAGEGATEALARGPVDVARGDVPRV